MPENKTTSGSKVRVVNPLTDREWNARIVRCSNSTIFHSANWAGLLAETYQYRPRYVILANDTDLSACLPLVEVDSIFTGRRGVSLCFCDFCGALVEDQGAFKQLLDGAIDLGRRSGWRYLEFRGEYFLRNEIPFKSYAHHCVELVDDEVEMQSRLRESTARNIRKAVKEGVRVTTCQSLEGVTEYYRLHCLTRKRQGVPPQPKDFFKKLHEKIIAKGLGFTALARHGEALVAGVICLHFGRHAVYKFGASDLEFQHLRANNLVLWEAMTRCAREGCSSFSLGRTDLGNEGLINFKNGWGGVRTSLNYYKYDISRRQFVTEPERKDSSSYGTVFKRLPLSVLRMIGKVAYRHMG